MVPIVHFGSDKKCSVSAAVGLLTLCNALPHRCPKHLFTPNPTGGAMKPRGRGRGVSVCDAELCGCVVLALVSDHSETKLPALNIRPKFLKRSPKRIQIKSRRRRRLSSSLPPSSPRHRGGVSLKMGMEDAAFFCCGSAGFGAQFSHNY